MPSRSSNEEGAEGTPKNLWVRVDLTEPWETRRELIEAALEAKADLVIVKHDDLDRIRKMGVRSVGMMVSPGTEAPPGVVPIDPEPHGEPQEDTVALLSIAGGADQDRAIELADHYGTIVVDCTDWLVIPLENLVAACQRTGCQLIAVVSSAAEAETALGVLQRGVDGVMLQATSPDDVQKTASLVRPTRPSLELVEAEVVSIESVGMGDRACIDTCSMLEMGEGLLIGSQADGLVLVHGETITTEYVEARPFRVNAGAIHSYVLHLDDKTRYLSDLRAGDKALVVGANGSVRVVTIGRVKIETRPLSMLELQFEDQIFKVILQDAETIRLVRPDGQAISIKELKEGDRVLAYLSGKARHFGMAIEEKLIER